MPHLARILTYPVKSLDGQSLPNVPVLASGALADDRRFALVDAAGGYVNAKRFAAIHRLRSTFDAAGRTLSIRRRPAAEPATFHLDLDRPALERWLGEFFGFAVTVVENAAAGHPDDTDSPGPTVISTATLAAVAAWFPGTTVDGLRARLRANLEVDGVPAFWEDRLYGAAECPRRFRIGDVSLDGINPCQRCAVPPRDPVTGQAYPDFVATFRRCREASLPAWADRSRFNHFYRLAVNTRLAPTEAGKHFRVGDPVEIQGPASPPL